MTYEDVFVKSILKTRGVYHRLLLQGSENMMSTDVSCVNSGCLDPWLFRGTLLHKALFLHL